MAPHRRRQRSGPEPHEKISTDILTPRSMLNSCMNVSEKQSRKIFRAK